MAGNEQAFARELEPERKEIGVIPIFIGAAVAGAALLLSGGKNLVGTSFCDLATQKARVKLNWKKYSEDMDYDVIRDGSIIDTVRGTDWISLSIEPPQQGQTHKYQVAGRVTGKESNEISIQTAVCTGVTGAEILNVGVSFNGGGK